MNKSDLKAACNILGSAEFWDSRRAGPEAVPETLTRGPAWDNASIIADASLRLVFLDTERFSGACQYRERMKELSSKVRSANAVREKLSGCAAELSDIRKTWCSMAEQGWALAQQEDRKEQGAATWEALSLEARPQFRLMLDSAIKLEDPLLALSLSSHWAYGRRRLARRMARDGDIDMSQVRHWSCLLKNSVSTFASDSASLQEEERSVVDFIATTGAEQDSIDQKLTEQTNIDRAALSGLSSELDDAKLRLRENLIRLLFGKNLSPEALGDAASSPWGIEVRALREALWFPLAPVAGLSAPGDAAQLSAENIAEILSQNGLSSDSDGLGYVGGRLAGGHLERRELFALRKSEFMEYLRKMVLELAPDATEASFRSLPAPERGAQDARAGLDIARRTAMEIVKLRSFIKASLDLEIEEVSKTVEKLKLSFVEGLGRPNAGPGDVKELQANISSLRRDVARLAKWVQDELSSAFESDIVKDLLFVVDDLSRITSHAGAGTAGGLVEAIEMVLSRLDGTFSRRKIRRIAAVGEHFNPSLHDCIGTRKVSGVVDGTVLEEVSIGYTIGDKVLRPAKVIVCG